MDSPRRGSVLARSLPLLLVTLVNRSGTIGLGLLPILLVRREVPTGRAALVMGAVKLALVLGLFAGGALCDLAGARRATLSAFVLSGLGFALLPLAPSVPLLAAAAVLAQLGDAVLPASNRLLLAESVPPEGRREALGWLRSAANLGQIVSLGVGAALGRGSLTVLLWLDSATSFAAAIAGSRLLRPHPASGEEGAAPRPETAEAAPGSSRRLFAYAAVIAAYTLVYELFFVSLAAVTERAFAGRGPRVFSAVMLINVVLCGLLAVVAARRIVSVDLGFGLGIGLTGAGAALASAGTPGVALLSLGTLLVTLGEIAFGAVAQHALLGATPEGPRRGRLYAAAQVVATSGRIAGGALAFPLVVDGAHGARWIAALTLGALALWALARASLLRG